MNLCSATGSGASLKKVFFIMVIGAIGAWQTGCAGLVSPSQAAGPGSGNTTSPTVAITSPVNGATVSGTAAVMATASNVGVASVQFQLDGANVGGADTAAPYSFAWDTTKAANGTHKLMAVAKDAGGKATTSAAVSVTVKNSTSDTTPPTVSITAPANGARVTGNITLSANATDNVAVAGVQFELDGKNLGTEITKPPYSMALNSTTLANGNHTLNAMALDTANNSTLSATVSITVSNATTPPTPPPTPGGPLAAFPGAQGGGGGALGGRGGVVMEVTSLNDSGPGTLRACVEASGPRTCVFRVAGVITPQSRLEPVNPYLTIAGQTAPGGGITLSGKSIGTANAVLFVATHDVVIRYITCSIGLGNHVPGPATGAVCFEIASGNAHDVIFDHVTARWWDNKGFITYTNTPDPIKSTTLQWALMYEPHIAHPVGPMTDDGMGLAHLETDQDFHHNLFANIGHRLPLFNTASLHWVNNIVYNWDYFASQTQGGTKSDFIGNKYKAGPLNTSGPGAPAHAKEFEFDDAQSSDAPINDMPGPPSVYVSGNIGVSQANPNGNQWAMTAAVASEGGSETTSPIPPSWQRSTPLPTQPFPIIADPVTNLDSILLPTVGNSQRLDCLGNWVNKRDSADTRVIGEYQAGNAGAFFTVEDANHVIPPIDPGTACTDSDHDGIPDAYETAHGLNPNDPSDAKKDSGNGYTWLERYLNGPDGSTFNLKEQSSTWAATRPVADPRLRQDSAAGWNLRARSADVGGASRGDTTELKGGR